MRALVTGGAGFIGSNLVKKLVNDGWNVDVVDDLSSGRLDLLQDVKHITLTQSISSRIHKFTSSDDKMVTVFVTSFDDKRILQRIKMKMYDVVYHVAAIPRVSYSVENPAETNEINVAATVRLFEACAGSVKRVVFSSSSSVYGGSDIIPTPEWAPLNPKSPYALQKRVGEDYARMFGEFYDLDIVSLRYFNVFGPGQYAGTAYSTAVAAWCHAVKNNLPLRSDGDGSQSRDMCYVDNVVHANILAATSKSRFMGKAYNIACGDNVSNKEILDHLRTRYTNIVVNDAPWRPGDVMKTQANINLAREELGYEPLVRFWDGLELTKKWWGI